MHSRTVCVRTDATQSAKAGERRKTAGGIPPAASHRSTHLKINKKNLQGGMCYSTERPKIRRFWRKGYRKN